MQDNFREIEWGMAISWLLQRSALLLRGLRGGYGVNVPLFSAKIALRGSYGIESREGVTEALWPWSHLCVKPPRMSHVYIAILGI